MPLPRLYTPEEVAAEIGHLSPFTIRGLVAKGKVPSIRGAHGAVLFTEGLVLIMLERLTVWPDSDELAPHGAEEPDLDDDLFGATSRSRARARSAAERRKSAKT